MGSSFFGLNIGQQGLFTAQTNLNITSHNIANAETDGYSRQYGVQTATRALPAGPRGMIGTGSEVTTVLQHRDSYLDDKYWSMINELGEFEVKDELLSQLETIFNEPSDTGYSTFFNDVFENLQTLSKNPGDTTARSTYIDSMNAFSTYMNDVGAQLMAVQKEANFGISLSVSEINFHAQQLATLNNQIGNLELTGSVANDLRDERNRLVDSLAKIVNVTTKEATDINGKKTFQVTINGQILVSDTTANYLKTVPRDTLNNPEDGVNMYDIYWESGKELYLDLNNLSGELRGYIDLRDGNNGENFKGTLLSGEGTATLTFGNPSRTDIPQIGELNIKGTLMRYNSFTYDSVLDQIEFKLGPPASVDGQTAFKEDVYGNVFSETVTWISEEQVQLTNPGNQDLEQAGDINIDGVMVTYTGYSKSATPPYTITLDIAAPAGSDGTVAYSGDSMTFKGVPYYQSQLNEFIRTIAKEFNAINESGRGGGQTQLFTYEGYTGSPALDVNDPVTYEAMTVHNFQINPAVAEDLGLIEVTAATDGGESSNDLLLKLIDKRHDVTMFDQGEPDNFMEALIGELGIDAKQVMSLMTGQESLINLVSNQRLSVSGVDINEESTNLIKYQQAYDLAAQIISVMNEIFDTTINRMGV